MLTFLGSPIPSWVVWALTAVAVAAMLVVLLGDW